MAEFSDAFDAAFNIGTTTPGVVPDPGTPGGGLTRTALRDYARKLARIEEHDVSDEEMNAFLHEGYDRIVMHTNWPWMYDMTADVVKLTRNIFRYPTAPHIVQVQSVIHIERGYQLRSISKNEIDRMLAGTDTRTDPTHYFWKDGTLIVAPTPGTTIYIEVNHIVVPVFGYADTDVPVFNPIFHRILVDWCLHRVWEMEEDFEKSQEYRMRFEDGVARMTVWYNTLMQDTPNIYGESPSHARLSNMPFLDDARH